MGSVSPKPCGGEKSSNAIIGKKDDDNTDNYGMFVRCSLWQTGAGGM